jgi:site-specific recombinase XerD
VNFFTGKLFVPKSKEGEARHVELNSRVRAVLQMINPTPAGGRIHSTRSPRHWFEDAVEKSGITKFTWHCLRHTFCSWLVMNGVDILTVSRLAGHKSITMTRRYSHLAPSILDEACEKTIAPTATEQKSSAQQPQVSIP